MTRGQVPGLTGVWRPHRPRKGTRVLCSVVENPRLWKPEWLFLRSS